MNVTATARPYGIIGTVGGVSLILLALFQLAGNLADTLDTIFATVGFVGLTVCLVGLLRVGATPTNVGRAGLIIWMIGMLAIVGGGLLDQVFSVSEDANLLYPIGGIAQLAGGLIAGISIARAAVVEGWLRWAPLAWAIAFVVALPFGFTDSAMSAVTFLMLGVVASATPVTMLRGVLVRSPHVPPSMATT